MSKKVLSCGKYSLNYEKRTLIMGIVNVTPDSFSDGGQFLDSNVAIKHGIKLASEGADILDIGGESTRPGSEAVSQEDELKRVIPVIEGFVSEVDVPISIDTCKSEVARLAIEAGACIVNDISAMRFDPKIADVAAEHKVPIILMHMKGTPKNMQKDPEYEDVMGEISGFLKERVDFAQSKGISKDQIIVDPGIGFGKTIKHNYDIIKNLKELKVLKQPILMGTSRKSFIGKTLDLDVDDRLEGTLATVTMSIINGADIVRVHDVCESKRTARMTDAIYKM
jgi:dihydropteroate synthase